jgi:mannose-1-phosphate guanylyltransferase
MVLCAGLGTRLRPLTCELPKPLVPVGDRSILAHIASRLRAAGLGEAVLNTHHLPDAFSSEIEHLDVRFKVVHEPEIRGTAGGLAGARALLGPPPVLVCNGDILVDAPIRALLEQADDGLCLAVSPRPAGEGTVGLGARGEVVRLRGEHFGDEASGGDYVGVAAVGGRCLEALPAFGCLIGDWALPELRAGGHVGTVPAAPGFVDVGDAKSYLEANLAWLRANAGPLGVWVGAGAVVGEGVLLSESVVGAGAWVRGSGPIERCVLWPGARASAPLAGAIVTPGGQVVRATEAATE